MAAGVRQRHGRAPRLAGERNSLSSSRGKRPTQARTLVKHSVSPADNERRKGVDDGEALLQRIFDRANTARL